MPYNQDIKILLNLVYQTFFYLFINDVEYIILVGSVQFSFLLFFIEILF